MTLITLCSIGAFLGQQFFWLSLTRDYFDISFGDKFWHKSCPNICRLFWLFWKVGIPLIKNHRCGYFLATVGKFGLLLIPTFGHTGSNLHWTHYLLPYLIQAHISTDRQIGEKDAILARFTFGKCQILYVWSKNGPSITMSVLGKLLWMLLLCGLKLLFSDGLFHRLDIWKLSVTNLINTLRS